MGKRLELFVEEDEEDLKQQLSKANHKMTYQKLQALYLYKINSGIGLTILCELLNKSQSQVKRWYKNYREGGLDDMLFFKQLRRQLA